MPHTIALRGPWQVSTINVAGHVVSDLRVNVRQATDWDSWITSDADVNQWAMVTFVRRFNWPAGTAEDMQLVWQGALPQQIWLNDVEILKPFKHAEFSVPIHEQVGFSNQLKIAFDARDRVFPAGFRGLLSAVALSITDD
ncbi:MAG: hypothetical protein P8J33_08780 [Pirellulaceae bacterium]|nr:hypothetical protein [Pirellulaceae bacterium]